MVSTWSSGSSLQPNLYPSLLDYKSQEGLTFVDFLPNCEKHRGIFSKPEYESFRPLVDRANDWLRANPQWEIKTCESVEFKCKGGDIDTEKMTYIEYSEHVTWYIRGLRLWIIGRKYGDEKCQQIGYLNLVPEQSEKGGFFSYPKFQTLDEVIAGYNAQLQTKPIPGRIITVETQEMKMKNYNEIKPDKSFWVESGSGANSFLFVIRIFFEITDAHSENIGIKDFIPDITENGGIFSMPKYEPFSALVAKASDWCCRQTDLRICNVQSLEIKVRKGKEGDSQKMHFVEHGTVTSFYIRILRVAYAKSPPHLKMDSNYFPQVTQITCKTFVPVQLTSSIFLPKFETLQETKQRISAWMKATGAQVISVETAALRIFSGGEAKYGTEASYTFNQAERDEYWIFVIRVFMNGIYKEPPEEILPPVPELESQNCCAIF